MFLREVFAIAFIFRLLAFSSLAIAQPNIPENFLSNIVSTSGQQLGYWTGGIVTADINNDGQQEIIFKTYDNFLHMLDSSGNNLPGSPFDLAAFTGIPHVPQGTSPFYIFDRIQAQQVYPAVGDLDGDGTQEIVMTIRMEDPFTLSENSYLFVLNYFTFAYGNFPLQGVNVGALVSSSPTLVDLDNDGHGEIILGGKQVSPPGGPDGQATLFVFRDDGSVFNANYPKYFTSAYGSGYFSSNGPLFFNVPIVSTAASFDMNGDGYYDIIFVGSDSKLHVLDGISGQELLGWPKFVSSINANPVIGDINGGGVPEIILVEDLYTNAKLTAFDYLGNYLPGFPAVLSANPYGGYTTTPLLYDLDHNGILDIVLASEGQVNVIDGAGSQLPGWPQLIASEPISRNSHVQVLDIDGNGYEEVLLMTEAADVYCWFRHGVSLPGFPLSLSLTGFSAEFGGTPIVTDLKGDGQIDLVAAMTYNANYGSGLNSMTTIFGANLFGVFNSAGWNQFQHDTQHGGMQ